MNPTSSFSQLRKGRLRERNRCINRQKGVGWRVWGKTWTLDPADRFIRSFKLFIKICPGKLMEPERRMSLPEAGASGESGVNV